MQPRVSEKLVPILIVILIIVAIGLGVAIYMRSGNALPFLSQPNTAEQSQNVSTQVVTPKGLTPDEQAVFQNAPSINASEQEQIEFSGLIAKAAKRSDRITITECSEIDPVVIQLEEGQEFALSNKDDVKHQIGIGPGHTYDVGPNEELMLVADFGKGLGVYGYSCDFATESVGYIQIIPKSQQ